MAVLALINWLVGGLCVIVVVYLAFGPQADITSVRTAAFSLLSAFTYLWVGYNLRVKANGAGLGWFSLFVTINAALIALLGAFQAETGWEI